MKNPERSLEQRLGDHYLNKADKAEKQGDRELADHEFAKAEKADLMAEYRKLQARASELSKNYHGSEAEYVELMNTLLQWDELIDLHDLPAPSTPREEYAALELNEHNPKLIDDFLSTASKNADAFLESTLSNQNEHTEKGVLFQKSDLVFLPGANLDQNKGDGKRELKEAKFDEIIKDIVGLLRKNGIFDDDVVIIRGADPQAAGMMREAPYYKIEIPRLNRTVLACEQIGESTYVIQAEVTNEFIAEYTKEGLLDMETPKTIRVKRGGDWALKLHDALFTDNAPGKKKDLRATAKERKERTSEEWAKMIREHLSLDAYLEMPTNIRVTHAYPDGIGIVGIGSLWGQSSRDSMRKKGQLEIAKRIWTSKEDIERINRFIDDLERTPEEWAAIISKEISLDQYLDMGAFKRGRFRFPGGMKIHALATLFGITSEDANKALGQLKIAKHIWKSPESIRLINAEMDKATIDPTEFVETVRQTMTLNEFLAMNTVERRVHTYAFDKGAITLGNAVGLPKPTWSTVRGQLEIAKRVWTSPEDQARILHLMEVEDRTPQEWAEKFRESISLEDYLSMGSERLQTLKVDGVGILKIGGMFNVSKSNLTTLRGKFELAKHIWTSPEEQARIESEITRIDRSPEEWANLVKKGLSLEDYLSMPIDQRSRIRLADGIGIVALANLFKISSKQVALKKNQLELAKHIWTSPEEQQKIQKEIDKIA